MEKPRRIEVLLPTSAIRNKGRGIWAGQIIFSQRQEVFWTFAFQIPLLLIAAGVGGKRKATHYKFSTMPGKSEKERRKQIMDDLKKKADQGFESSLPMSRENFKKLFDHLDIHLTDKDCDDTNILTKTFLVQSGNENVDQVLEWLANYGGYCDCEILANFEEQFE